MKTQWSKHRVIDIPTGALSFGMGGVLSPEYPIQEARLYQKTEFDIMKEVNTQTEALLNLPDNMNNIYLNKHITSFGNFNFYNLLIVHYSYDCTKDEFKLMNKGRFKEVKDNILIVGDYIFEFDIEEKLKEVREF